jgi:hypothetical protein
MDIVVVVAAVCLRAFVVVVVQGFRRVAAGFVRRRENMHTC